MRFGICTGVENAGQVKEAGWDFVEEHVQNLLQGQLPDAEWNGLQRVTSAALPVSAANCLVPPALKIIGPAVDLEALRGYMGRVMERAQKVGIKTLVFGSGGARNVPDGFDRQRARKQIMEFIRLSADLAARHGITLVAEHLNVKECNIINSLDEAMTYVKAANHPNFQCLVDSYHFWLEEEPLQSLRDAMPWIRHVHLADTEQRVAPGLSGKNDYRPFFRALKNGGYTGPISVEPLNFNIPRDGEKVLEFVVRQWNDA